jgi:hypothetical protein
VADLLPQEQAHRQPALLSLLGLEAASHVVAAATYRRSKETELRYSGITVWMCSSLSCFAVTGVGLCAIRS